MNTNLKKTFYSCPPPKKKKKLLNLPIDVKSFKHTYGVNKSKDSIYLKGKNFKQGKEQCMLKSKLVKRNLSESSI